MGFCRIFNDLAGFFTKRGTLGIQNRIFVPHLSRKKYWYLTILSREKYGYLFKNIYPCNKIPSIIVCLFSQLGGLIRNLLPYKVPIGWKWKEEISILVGFC